MSSPKVPGSPWIDLTESHKSIREEMEYYIRQYVYNKEKEYRTPIIVAPFGSGKSTLLKHLNCYSWNILKVPAMLVNLSNIVEYIRNEVKRKIPEDLLTKFIEQFFENHVDILLSSARTCEVSEDEARNIISKYRENKVKGVILIDEIEESYKKLKDIIEAETTPFRGLFDDVKDGRSRVFPIMAFGPSSILMEAASLAGGWRTIIKSIPLVSVKNIYNLLKEKDYDIDYNVCKLIANMLWWASKGRYGWVYMLIQAGIPRSIINSLNIAKRNKHYLKDKDFIYDESVIENLEKNIVRNIPLFRKIIYNKDLRKLKGPERELFKILTALVGPIPEKTLSNYIDVEMLSQIVLNKNIFIKSDKAIDYSLLLNYILRSGKKLAREYGLVSEDEIDVVLDELRLILEMVFDSWSINGLLLLPSDLDIDPIEKLIDLSISISLETYKSRIISILEKIDLRSIIDRIIRDGKLVKLDNIHYALNPDKLLELYPPIMVKPLIACSKEEIDLTGSLEDILAKEYKNGLDFIEQILRQFREFGISDIDSIPKNISMYFVLSSEHIGFIEKLIISDIIDGRIPMVVPLAISGKDLDMLKDNLFIRLRPYVNTHLIIVPEYIGPRQSLFLLSLLYSIFNCPRQLKELNPIEKYIAKQYLKSSYAIIMNEIRNWYRQIGDIRRSIQNIMDFKHAKEIAKSLERSKGHGLGSKQARYFWIVPIAGSELIDELTNLIKLLSDLRPKFSQIFSEIYELIDMDPTKISEKIDAIYFKIRLLSQDKKANKYLRDSKNLLLKIESLNKNELVKDLNDVLYAIIADYIHSTDIRISSPNTTIDQLISNIDDRISSVLNNTLNIDLPDPFKYQLIAMILKQIINSKTYSKELIMPPRLHSEKRLSSFLNILDNIINNIDTIINTDRYSFNSQLLIKLKNARTLIERLANDIRNIKYAINKVYDPKYKARVDKFELKIYTEFIIGSIVDTLSENLSKIDVFAKFNSLLNEVSSKLDEILTSIHEDFLDYYEDILRELNIYEQVRESIESDLTDILKTTSLSKLSKKLDDYMYQIDKLRKTINKYKPLINKTIRLKNEIELLNRKISMV